MTLWEAIKQFFGGKPAQAPAPVTPAPRPTNPFQEPPKSFAARVLGLDVSHYQNRMASPEWLKLFSQGYRFVYAKCNDGHTGPDILYAKHRELAKLAGFLFGGYHYLRFDHDPKEQARQYHEACAHQVGELPPVLDVEWDKLTVKHPQYGKDGRMDEAAADMAYECLLEIERLFGVQPILYTNAYFWPNSLRNAERFKRFLVWIPAYAANLKPSGDKVHVPYPWKQWTFWQDFDQLACGPESRIDTNVFRGSLEDLQALTKKS